VFEQEEENLVKYNKWRYAWLSLATSLLLICSAGWVWGQVPPSAVESLPTPLRQFENLSGLSSLLDTDAEITRSVIRLDGRRLFVIAVPALEANSENGDQQDATSSAVESREQIIEERLQRIVEQGFDPGSLEVIAETEPNSRQPVIYVNSTEDGETETEQLLTVTALDAEANGTNLEDWAAEVSERIRVALVTAQQERQPQYLQRQGLFAAGILITVGIFSWSLYLWQRQLKTERKSLSAQSKTNSTELSAASADPQLPSQSTTALLQRRAENQQKQRVNDIKWRLSQITQILFWGIGFFLIVGLFPYTRWLQPLIVRWIQIPIRLLMIALATYLVIRLSEILVDRLFWALQSSTRFAPDTSQRLILRFTTFSRVAKSIAALVLGTIGLIVAISAVGISISPALLTIAGIVGVGISLASQNLIKDVINGFLILLEDQYGVGDVISVGPVSGLVENMNLRITQLRSATGHLITIPNSAITVVENLSKEWSRVDISVSVAYEADLDQALAVTGQVAETMSHDPVWQDLILEPPQLLGVDNLDNTGATIRLWIKTQPLKQWDVAREYRRRLKLAFDRAGIPIGIPQQSLWLGNSSELEHALPKRNHSHLSPEHSNPDMEQIKP
jgi:moderate conductance mechanosensitive channel